MTHSRVRESTAEIADQIKAAIREQERERIELAVDERAEQMRDYAISISPEDSGEYKSKFEIEKKVVDDLPARTLTNTDDKAGLLEYGTQDTPEFAVLTRTAGHFGGATDR